MAAHILDLVVVLSVIGRVSTTCQVLANGSVWDKVTSAIYNPPDVWDVGIKSCVCQKVTCINKCCSRGKHFNEMFQCDYYSSTLTLPPHLLPPVEPSIDSYGFVTLRICSTQIPLDPSSEEYYFLPNGSLHANILAGRPLPQDKYCVDDLEGDSEPLVLVCAESVADPEPLVPVSFYIYPVFLTISLFFLLATLVLIILTPEGLSVHKRSALSHICSLLVAYAFLISVYLLGKSNHAFCIPSAFIIYFSFLASFFWLNVMCLDIFWTFSGFRSLRGSVKEREFKKFIIYSIYSWGCPLIMLTVCLVMHFHEGIPDDYVKPGFGVNACWFQDTISALAYFYGPVAVLILCNIILFILTALKIAKLKKEADMFNNSESRRHDDEDNKQRFNLYLKLFLVMGVNWATEIISWAAGGPEYLWYLTDIANTLQGVLIFIIFVWKDRIRKLLMERFCPKRAASAAASKSTGITYSSRGSSSTTSMKPGAKINQESLRMTNMVTSEESDVP